MFVGSIRIKSKGSSNRALGSSPHRFRANPLKSQDRESMEEEEEEEEVPSKVISSSSRPVSGKEMKISLDLKMYSVFSLIKVTASNACFFCSNDNV